MPRTHKHDDKIQETVDILKKNMYPKTMKILGNVATGYDAKLWLQIEETTPNQMRKHAIYLSIIIRDGEFIGEYVGSATAEDDGYRARADDYEFMKLKGFLTKEEARSEHLRMILQLADD
jgi:hypothetical protein